jgi:hypothetical protein
MWPWCRCDWVHAVGPTVPGRESDGLTLGLLHLGLAALYVLSVLSLLVKLGHTYPSGEKDKENLKCVFSPHRL